MKFNILSISLALAAVAAFSSCGDDWQPGGDSQFAPGTGGAYSGTINVNVAEEPIKAQGRANASSPDYSSFLVSVTAKGSDEVVKYAGEECRWAFKSMPEIITLPVGDYTLHVASHTPQPVAWASPYFEGETDFSVISGKAVNIGTVHCSFRSLKIGVHFDDSFLKWMDTEKSSVTVTAGAAGTSTVWHPSETRCAYFQITDENPTVIVSFTGVLNGKSYTVGKTVPNAKPGDYYIFNFSLNLGNPEIPDEFGSSIIPASGISIDVDMVNENLPNQLRPGEDIPSGDEKHPNAEEWPEDPIGPGPENPDDPTPPSGSGVTMKASQGVLTDGVNDIKDGQTYFIEFDTESPITSMTVKIDSPYLTDDFLNPMGLSTTLDLGNPGDLKDTFSNEPPDGFGLKTGSDVLGKTYVPFDLTGLIPLLNADDIPHVHKFTVTILTEGREAFVHTLQFRNKGNQ